MLSGFIHRGKYYRVDSDGNITDSDGNVVEDVIFGEERKGHDIEINVDDRPVHRVWNPEEGTNESILIKNRREQQAWNRAHSLTQEKGTNERHKLSKAQRRKDIIEIVKMGPHHPDYGPAVRDTFFG